MSEKRLASVIAKAIKAGQPVSSEELLILAEAYLQSRRVTAFRRLEDWEMDELQDSILDQLEQKEGSSEQDPKDR